MKKFDSSLIGIECGCAAYTLFFQKHTFLGEAERTYPNTFFSQAVLSDSDWVLTSLSTMLPYASVDDTDWSHYSVASDEG